MFQLNKHSPREDRGMHGQIGIQGRAVHEPIWPRDPAGRTGLPANQSAMRCVLRTDAVVLGAVRAGHTFTNANRLFPFPEPAGGHLPPAKKGTKGDSKKHAAGSNFTLCGAEQIPYFRTSLEARAALSYAYFPKTLSSEK